jgi:rhamnosyltransferase
MILMTVPSCSVCAVIVSYQPDLAAFGELVEALAIQVDAVIVVDNGSSPACVEHLRATIRGARMKLIECDSNLGIAAAQNIGVRVALDAAHSHVLFMDHDSTPLPGMVDALLAAEAQLAADGIRVAAVGPDSIDRRTGSAAGFVRFGLGRIRRVRCRAGEPYKESDFLIASGMLVAASVLKDVGLMNAGYFIDHVDTEWCLRARLKGWRIFGVCEAKLLHRLGDSVTRIWMGRWREVGVHSPLRDYYGFRNTVLMLADVPMPLLWRIAFLYRLMLFLMFLGVGIAPRAERIRMMMLGFWHGLRGRTGPYET